MRTSRWFILRALSMCVSASKGTHPRPANASPSADLLDEKPCLHRMVSCIRLCLLPRTRRQTTMDPIVKLACGLVFLAALSAPSPAQSPAERVPEVKAAVDGVLGLFQQKPVVVLCDQHGLAQEEDFYSGLVRDPRFVENVGNVIVEFGGEASQGIIDRYVAGEDVPLNELRRVWTQTAGWVPGPTFLGYINFFANVRAANRGLAPEHRIKMWLGEPKVDWSKIETFQGILPFLLQRDDNYFRIIRDEILLKHKKTLLIIGIGHIFGQGKLRAKLVQAYPDTLATVV